MSLLLENIQEFRFEFLDFWEFPENICLSSPLVSFLFFVVIAMDTPI